ncbi:carboxypeptidase-like regulatory domain-containing protein [Robiginitalea sp.]|uniref:carboxypeptidase-like regulatory domain-containing protein n=1 Tax=Robiginitalea sp. TaxID=1902411 RepID=UPI003C3A26CA
MFLLLSPSLEAQLAFLGQVVDAETGKPIPFVNIGVVNRGIGTVSNEEGDFLLQFRRHEVQPGDILRISSLGYVPTEVPLSRLKQSTQEFIFRLQPTAIDLDEVIVSTAELFEVEEEVGYPNLAGQGIGYWKDSIALGGELGSRIRVDKGLRRLKALFFQVMDNPSDSIQLRVNIYDVNKKRALPGQNLNSTGRSILYTLRYGEVFTLIDLNPFDIWVRDDFIVTLELLGVYGTDKIGLSLPAARKSSGRSFRRYASQDVWERIDEAVVGLTLQTTLFTDNKRKIPKPRELRRRQRREREISGQVFYESPSVVNLRAGRQSPLKGATIINYTRNEVVTTDRWGRYKMSVNKGDKLVVKYPGMFQIAIVVVDFQNLNFQLHREKELPMRWNEN